MVWFLWVDSYIKIYLAATLIIQSSLLFSEKRPVGLHSSSERFGGQVAKTSKANQICWQTTKFSKLVFEINSSTSISLKGNQVVLASLSANKTIVIRKEETLYEEKTSNGIYTGWSLKQIAIVLNVYVGLGLEK